MNQKVEVKKNKRPPAKTPAKKSKTSYPQSKTPLKTPSPIKHQESEEIDPIEKALQECVNNVLDKFKESMNQERTKKNRKMQEIMKKGKDFLKNFEQTAQRLKDCEVQVQMRFDDDLVQEAKLAAQKLDDLRFKITNVKVIVERSKLHWEHFNQKVNDDLTRDREFQKDVLDDVLQHIQNLGQKTQHKK